MDKGNNWKQYKRLDGYKCWCSLHTLKSCYVLFCDVHVCKGNICCPLNVCFKFYSVCFMQKYPIKLSPLVCLVFIKKYRGQLKPYSLSEYGK